MPVALHAETTGPLGAEPVFLGGALGSTYRIWDELVAELSTDYQVVALDLRGHGDSPSAVGTVTVADLAADVAALAGRLRIARFHYVGISLGGAVGQQLALDHASLLASLTLACTAAKFGESDAWHDRAVAVREDGMAQLRGATGERWFADDVRRERPDRVRKVLDALVRTDPGSYAACCEALAVFDTRPRLRAIGVPTRVVTGSLDPTCPPAVTGVLADGIPGADAVTVDGAAHLANIARPAEFAAAVREHLAAHPISA